MLAPALLVGAAHLTPTPADQPTVGTIIFVSILLAAGSIGEELFFRGYGFQELLAAVGPWATVIPVGVIFAPAARLESRRRPGSARQIRRVSASFSATPTCAAAICGCRSGLHFGWNFTLPLFGVNVSGLRMKVTGYEMSWTAGSLWSGGEYGPEASILTSVVLIALFVYLCKAPIRRQVSPLTDPPAGSEVCEASPSSPS